MKYNSEIHHRRSIRLKGYDYSLNEVYFVTICTFNRESLFGEITNDTLILNELGKILETEWQKAAEIRKNIIIDEFVIMPNHVHGIKKNRKKKKETLTATCKI